MKKHFVRFLSPGTFVSRLVRRIGGLLMCLDQADEIVRERFIILDKDGDGGYRVFTTRQHAECARDYYDYEYPTLAPHRVISLEESADATTKARKAHEEEKVKL